MRILCFGDDVWAVAVLRKLLELPAYEIAGVVLRKEPRNDLLRTFAAEKTLLVLQPSNVNSEDFYQKIRQLRPDVNLSVSYDQIFREKIISSATVATINCHNGLLPNYCGGGGLYGAVINGERYFGQTVHWVNTEIDAGDIIVQDVLPIEPLDYMSDLEAKALANMPSLVVRALGLIVTPGFVARKQGSSGSYFPKKPEGDEIIDWTEPSLLLVRRIHARNPGPGNVTFLNGRKIYVWRASLTDTPSYIGTVGQVVGIERGRGVRVKTGDSAILVEEIQFEDESERRVPSFRIGTTFFSNWRAEYVKLKSRLGELESRLAKIEALIGEK